MKKGDHVPPPTQAALPTLPNRIPLTEDKCDGKQNIFLLNGEKISRGRGRNVSENRNFSVNLLFDRQSKSKGGAGVGPSGVGG